MILGDRYRLIRELGSGGAATVWLAEDFVGERQVAVKWLHGTEGATTRRERLEREARLLESLQDTHVVRVFDVGEHDGRPYIVMELVDGGSLADRVNREGPMRPVEAVRTLLSVLDALGKAHALGIVHRDVKPGNVMLRSDGSVVLCDFGIARQDTSEGDTRTGVALGSMGYMAPEQRVDARRVGPEADVYAAACTLFNLVSADTPVDLYLAPDHSPRWEGVPAPLRPILRRATRSEPSARHHSVDELAADLRAVIPALDALPAVRSRMLEPVGHVPTRASEPEPSVKAQDRERWVDREEWSWSQRTAAPVGRSALWLGVTMVALASGLGLLAGPLTDLVAPRLTEVAPPPEPSAAVVVDVVGSWRGIVDGREAELLLEAGDPLRGRVLVHLGAGEMRAAVVGEIDGDRLALTETSGLRPGSWKATVSGSGLVVEGVLSREGEPELPFAFVRAPAGDAVARQPHP
ncbi:MAG: serine/threonine protein kinase [Alphaproteobacteria bacterium]|nr:serine/threonine protein kinase [Alphaproteobacteria bacterium]